MDPDPERVVRNLREVRDRLAAAARRSGRTEDAVRLVAVTKTVSTDTIRVLLDAGQLDIGENHAQQIRDRAAELGAASVRWHMIGRLQRNKVKYVVPRCAMIHSLDSLRLAQAVSKRAEAHAATATCLLEVNASGEETKSGLPPDAAPAAAEAVARLTGVRLVGLMTMAPFVNDPKTVRPVFADLRGLLDRVNREAHLQAPLTELSMGMTQDYEVAVEEGATLVRIGSALFR